MNRRIARKIWKRVQQNGGSWPLRGKSTIVRAFKKAHKYIAIKTRDNIDNVLKNPALTNHRALLTGKVILLTVYDRDHRQMLAQESHDRLCVHHLPRLRSMP